MTGPNLDFRRVVLQYVPLCPPHTHQPHGQIAWQTPDRQVRSDMGRRINNNLLHVASLSLWAPVRRIVCLCRPWAGTVMGHVLGGVADKPVCAPDRRPPSLFARCDLDVVLPPPAATGHRHADANIGHDATGCRGGGDLWEQPTPRQCSRDCATKNKRRKRSARAAVARGVRTKGNGRRDSVERAVSLTAPGNRPLPPDLQRAFRSIVLREPGGGGEPRFPVCGQTGRTDRQSGRVSLLA